MERRDEDLERLIDGELRRLPALTAPPQLLERVQRALQQKAVVPWWQTSWWSWPVPARIGSVALFMLLTLFLCAVPAVSGVLSALDIPAVDSWIGMAEDGWELLLALGNAFAITVRKLAGQPWVWVAAAVSSGTYLLLIAVGSCLVRYAVVRPSRRLTA